MKPLLTKESRASIKALEDHWSGIRAARAEVGLLDTVAPVGVTVRQYAQKYGLPYVSAG